MTDEPRDLVHEAQAADSRDPLRRYRDLFSLPTGSDGRAAAYLCGNSLGPLPVDARRQVNECLESWAERGVEGHFEGPAPWYSYHEPLREGLARRVGAKPTEVVAMNALTVNLHLMLASFFRPDSARGRTKIVADGPLFPSDRYALQSHLHLHGLDPSVHLIVLEPDSSGLVCETTIEAFLDQHGDEVALALFSGVNFLTGQRLDLRRLARAGQRAGCSVGCDLAHAVGNRPLQLHEDNIDFAVWCSYKYLNSGPGAVGGAFVHERHHRDDLLRLGGWWGNDPSTRFQFEDEFQPVPSADAWQVSNPPILSTAPLRSSLAIFDEAGDAALESKGEKLSLFLTRSVDNLRISSLEQLSPRDWQRRGYQVSYLVHSELESLQRLLKEANVITDIREPNVLRVTANPLYNSFEDVARFIDVLRRWGQTE